MRRRRPRLQVSTFPFLAVLLGAMGSLILVLLIMDRRAKRVALAKALQATAQAAAEDERAAAARRAEWERRHQELHARLAQEDQEVRGQVQRVLGQIETALADVRSEEERRRRLEEWLAAERDALARLEQEVAAARAKEPQAAGQSRAAQAEAARMAAELERMERTLTEVQEAHRRAQATYSVVPYRGSRGDNRRPIYVECTATGVVFHPQRQTVTGPELSRVEIRAEVERRIAARRPAPADNVKRNDDAYLLLLVRPDGIPSYYYVTEALQGLPLAFGYELIDADWILDFPQGEDEPAGQPWMTTTATGPVMPAPTGAAAPKDLPRGVTFGMGPHAPGGDGPNGSGPGPAGVVRTAPAAIREGDGRGGNAGTGGGTALGPGQDSARHAPAISAPSGSATRTGEAQPPSQARAPTSGAQREGSPPGSRCSEGDNPRDPSDSAAPAGAAEPGGARQPAAGSPGGTGDGADRSTSQPRPVRLGGNRDWIIQVECTAGALVLHPSRQRIPMAGMTPARGSDHPLAQAVQQMIARRQATVRPGELPYRPQVRFLVRPDGLRSFHLAYPALEALGLPMTRQDLGRGDEVPAP